MTIVKKVGRFFIVYAQRKLKTLSCKVQKDPLHRLLHRLGKTSDFLRFLAGVLKNSKRILDLEGCKKINLLLLIGFRSLPLIDNDVIECIETQASTLKPNQNLLLKLISGDTKLLKELIYDNPKLFQEFWEYLTRKKKGKGNRLDRIILSSFEPEVNLIRSKHNPDRSENRIACNLIHDEFCKDVNRNDSLSLNNPSNEYDAMIQGILNGNESKKLLKEHPFYPEARLYNEYLLSKVDPSNFDKSLLSGVFSTENEKIVYRFVKKKATEK